MAEQPQIQDIQFQGSARAEGFSPTKARAVDDGQRQRQALANSVSSMLGAEDARYKQELNRLDELSEFSNSLLNVLIERQEEANEQALNRGMIKFQQNKAAREAAIYQYDVDNARVQKFTDAANAASVEASKAGASYDVVEGLSQLSGWERQGYAIAMAKGAGKNWATFAMEGLKNDNTEIVVNDNYKFNINKPDKTPAETAQALQVLKEKWLSTGYNQLGDDLYAKHALPGIDKADEALMGAARTEYAIKRSMIRVDAAKQAFDPKDPATMQNLFNVLTTSVDSKGNTLGYAGAFAGLQENFVTRQSAGLPTGIDEFKDMQIPGEKEGVTYGSRFPSRFTEMENALRAGRVDEYRAKEADAQVQIAQLENELIAGLDENHGRQEVELAQRTIIDAKKRLGLPATRSTEIDAWYTGSSAEGQEIMEKTAYYNELRDQNLLDPAVIQNEPHAIRQEFMKDAKEQAAARDEVGGFKAIDKDLDAMVLGPARNSANPDGTYSGGVYLMQEHLKAQHRLRTQQILNMGKGTITAREAALQAAGELRQEFLAGQANQDSIYFFGTDEAGQNAGFVNFLTGKSNTGGIYNPASYHAAKKKNEQVKTTLRTEGAKALDKAGFLGDQTFLENIEKDYKNPGYAFPQVIHTAAILTNTSVYDVVNRQRAAMNLPPIPEYVRSAEALQNVDPAFRNHVNNLTAGRATANDVRRFHTKSWPVRPAHTAMVPQQGGMQGLLAVIRSGEGGWESINRGRAGDTPGGRPGLKQMAIGDIMKEQQAGRMFAVGAYQFIPGTLARAVKEAGLKPTDKFTPENQNRLAIALIMGSKRPRLAAYLNGTSDDINAAHLELSMEWAAVKGPDGRGYYDGDSAGNMGTINAAKTRQALMLARQYNLQQRQ